MSTDLPSNEPPEGKPTGSPEEMLPPVEPPSAGFLLQLFVIPMVIVFVIVMVWLAFNWLAHAGTSPKDLVANLQRWSDRNKQDALTLADMLRDPQQQELREDEELAQQVADVLTNVRQVNEPTAGQISLAIFLCRALAEFQTKAGLQTLVDAASTGNDNVAIRRTALEAIAIRADHSGDIVRQNESLVPVVLEASRSQSDDPKKAKEAAALREVSAFTLGVIGGDKALQRLAYMLDDSQANTRYNAATGLARHGDARAQRVLLEMLDPENPHAADAGEEHESAIEWKQLLVLVNGVRAAGQLLERNRTDDLAAVETALQELADSEVALSAQFEAREVLARVRNR